MILVITGIVLSGVYRAAVERAFDRRLGVYLRTLVADVATPDEAQERFPQSLGEPLFELPLSGWYWQVTRLDTARPEVRSSRSLWDATLHASRRERRDLDARRRAPGLYRRPRGAAPAGDRAHHRHRRRGPLHRGGRRRRRRDRRGDARLRPRADRDLHGARDRAVVDHDLPGPVRPSSAQPYIARAVRHPFGRCRTSRRKLSCRGRAAGARNQCADRRQPRDRRSRAHPRRQSRARAEDADLGDDERGRDARRRADRRARCASRPRSCATRSSVTSSARAWRRGSR